MYFVFTVGNQQSGFQNTLQNMVKVKMGMTALAGSKLLENKEKADEELKKEIRFLTTCFRETPEKAASLTQLQIAKEIKKEVLDQYNVLSMVEPNQIYRTVAINTLGDSQPVNHYSLMIPNRVHDLNEYWQRLFNKDLTIPPLKPYLVNEGEKIWKQILQVRF